MDHHADRGNQLVYVCVIFLTITWVAVLLRCFVRIRLLKAFKIDDWLLVLAELNFVLTVGLVFAGVRNGLGKHNLDVPIEPRIQAIKYQAIATITYTVVMALVKLSIGFFLLRISIERKYTYTIIGSMFLVAMWTIGIFFFNLFQCKPIKYQWDTRIAGSCISPTSYIIATFVYSILSIITDWFYALIPIPMVWPVITEKKTRILVSLPLTFGVFASVATIVRIKFLSDVLDFSDILWSPTDTMIWTIVEPGIAITAASMATMRPLLRQIASGTLYQVTYGDNIYNESQETPNNRQMTRQKTGSTEAEIKAIYMATTALARPQDLHIQLPVVVHPLDDLRNGYDVNQRDFWNSTPNTQFLIVAGEIQGMVEVVDIDISRTPSSMVSSEISSTISTVDGSEYIGMAIG